MMTSESSSNAPENMQKKILCVRLDKIGDLVSTLPVDEVFDHHAVHWAINQGLGFLAEQAVPARSFTEISIHQGRRDFRQLLKTYRPDLVVIFYAPWWASFEAFWAGVPLRVGRLSQWHSFLFLNQGLRQRRSLSERHESEYNLELAIKARDLLRPQPVSATDLTTETAPRSQGSAAPQLRLQAPLFRQLNEKFHLRQGYLLVHPGMAGSALNWPTSSYIQLIEKYLKAQPGSQVVVTGTQMDDAWTTPILAAFGHEPRVVSVVKQVSLRELLYLLKNAFAVVVPSTGVAHLAASLGSKTIALYSPVREHAAKRWGPRGPQVIILEPPPVTSTPPLDADPMTAISVDAVLNAVLGTTVGNE